MAQVRQVESLTQGIDGASIVALDKFIESTRDSGYKSTSSAVSELVDNSLQAGAKRVEILIAAIGAGHEKEFRVAVTDNGGGMNRDTLIQALRFGGSSRYNDRSGLGRFGMGLPNASFSQARRVTVYTWQHGQPILSTYLDVDEIASGELAAIPSPHNSIIPDWCRPKPYRSGTVVVWESCDRLDNRRLSTLQRKLIENLGRTYRYYLWNGAEISINGSSVSPIDPLFLDCRSRLSGARVFQEPVEFEIYASPGSKVAAVGKVKIVFSELPVETWRNFSNEDKRRFGITDGAGVSVVRGLREVDTGWFFIGKRRENYDDWWRCEIKFSPELDEAFGITHTKQQIRPRDFLVECLEPIVETAAKALNARVRHAHFQLKASEASLAAERVAAARDETLKPLPAKHSREEDRKVLVKLAKRNQRLRDHLSADTHSNVHYQVIEEEISPSTFYRPLISGDTIVALVDPTHPFYKKLYRALTDDTSGGNPDLGRALQLLLLAAARAEAVLTSGRERATLEKFRREWSEALDVLLRA